MANNGYWLCQRCNLLHEDGTDCPKQGEEAGVESGPSSPAILGKTREDSIRPDENDFAKEMRLSARAMEEDRPLDPATAEMFKRNIENYKGMPGKRFWKDREIPFVIPKEFRRKKYFSGGI